MGLLSVLVAPCTAYASPLDSFASGLGDFVNPQDVEVYSGTPEKDYMDSYNPNAKLESEPTRVTREYDADSTTVDYVNGTLDSFNTVPWTNNYDLLQSIRIFIGTRGGADFMLALFIIPSVTLVFFWWGVGKSIRMIMSAWRKGKQSV